MRAWQATEQADWGSCCEQVGAETFRLCRQLVDGIVLVDNAATSAAIRDVFNETRTILEPAGAVGVAGAKAYLKHYGFKVRRATQAAGLPYVAHHAATIRFTGAETLRNVSCGFG